MWCRCSTVVVQLIRNQQVAGSNPVIGLMVLVLRKATTVSLYCANSDRLDNNRHYMAVADCWILDPVLIFDRWFLDLDLKMNDQKMSRSQSISNFYWLKKSQRHQIITAHLTELWSLLEPCLELSEIGCQSPTCCFSEPYNYRAGARRSLLELLGGVQYQEICT